MTPHNWLTVPTRREISDRLERIELPADAKLILSRLMETTALVAGKVIEVGKLVLGFVFDLVKRFRGITFGVCIGLTVSALIASTPLVGGVLSALLTPLLVAFGLTMGALDDVRNGALRSDIQTFGRDLEASVVRA